MKNLQNLIISIFVFILFIPYVIANGDDGILGCYGHMWQNLGGYGMGFGFIFMILFWGIIIYLFVLLFKSFPGTNKNEKETPLDVLKKRLANGEITDEEFDKLKEKL